MKNKHALMYAMVSLMVILAMNLMYCLGKSDAEQDMVEQIKTQCVHAPSMLETSSGEILLVKYYPLYND